MMLPLDLHKPSIAVSYLQVLVDIVTERGHGLEALLQGVPIRPELLEQAGARMSPMQWSLAVARAMRLCDDPGLGYECGLRMRPTVNGFLGYATMSSGSLREAMELAARYVESRQRAFSISLSLSGGHATLELRQNHNIPVLREFFHEHILIGIAHSAAAMLGTEISQLEGVEICFEWREPRYHAAYCDRLPAVRFVCPANVLRFPAQLLERKPVLADPQASRQAVELCDRELAQWGSSGQSVSSRVRAELVVRAGGGYASQAEMAARLHLSSRTLARRLQVEGSSFRQLLDDARRRDGCTLIEQTPLALAEVAARLGFTNPANFTRAFRKWTGESPSDYRRRVDPASTF